MSLDIIDPVIMKNLNTIGGFCIVTNGTGGTTNYLAAGSGYIAVPAASIGLIDIPVGYSAAIKLVK